MSKAARALPARRYSYLTDSSSARGRAGSGDDPPLIWDSGE